MSKLEIIKVLRRVYRANRIGICNPNVDFEIERICAVKNIKDDLIAMDNIAFELQVKHNLI